MALFWKKKLHFHFHTPYKKNAFQQNRGSLWKALAPKPFEIQTWNWSRLKDFLKIFENVSFFKKLCFFLYLPVNEKKGVSFFFDTRGILKDIRLCPLLKPTCFLWRRTWQPSSVLQRNIPYFIIQCIHTSCFIETGGRHLFTRVLRDSTPRFVGPLFRWSVVPSVCPSHFTFSANMAPAYPYATGVAVYPALFYE